MGIEGLGEAEDEVLVGGPCVAAGVVVGSCDGSHCGGEGGDVVIGLWVQQ